jgi:hypothetical protein
LFQNSSEGAANFLMTLAFAEIAGRRITSAAERDRANATFLTGLF